MTLIGLGLAAIDGRLIRVLGRQGLAKLLPKRP